MAAFTLTVNGKQQTVDVDPAPLGELPAGVSPTDVVGFGIAGAFTGGIANLVDVLWPLWDEENRALHDFVVNTRVVKD